MDLSISVVDSIHVQGFFHHEGPAIIKTIKPGGGGDFTTLDAWEQWGDDQTEAGIWAECYSGGDLGPFAMGSNWSNIGNITSTKYQRVYVPEAERHKGKTNQGAYLVQDGSGGIVGAYIRQEYARIEGLRIQNTYNNTSRIITVDRGHALVDGNLIHSNSTSRAYGIWCVSSWSVDPNLMNWFDESIIRNNIVYFGSNHDNQELVGIYARSSNNDDTQKIYIWNNTCISDATTTGANQWGFYMRASGTNSVLDGYEENNIAMGFYELDFRWRAGETFTLTVNNLMSADDTADDYGSGTGFLINKSKTDQFIDATSDFNLKAGADALEAGKIISSFDNDASHEWWQPWRPQNSLWDLGALEKGSPQDDIDIEESVDLYPNPLNVNVNDTPLITEAVSGMDIVLQIGVVAETIAIAEWLDQYLDVYNVDVYDEVGTSESAEAIPTWQASVYDMVTVTEDVQVSKFQLKTIKPDGTGDYTTLQSWEDWADGQPNAAQWAECYAGGDLGAISIADWTGTPSATEYPRVYVPRDQRHQGKDNSVGAYIESSSAIALSVNENYTRVEGLRIEQSGSYNAVSLSAGGIVCDGNLIIHAGAAGYKGIALTINGGYTHTLRNNIVIVGHTQSKGIEVQSGSTATLYVYNNTVHKTVSPTSMYFGLNFVMSGGTLSGEMKNNVVTGFQYCYYYTGGGFNLTPGYNLSSDDSSDWFGGSGNLINKAAADQYVDDDADWNLKSTADAKDAGTTIATFDNDARDDVIRPQSTAWDMGALEYLPRADVSETATIVEDFDGFTNPLLLSEYEELLITEVASVLDLVVEVGIVDDDVTVTESVEQYLDELNLSVYDDVTIVEDFATIMEFPMSAEDYVSVSEYVTHEGPAVIKTIKPAGGGDYTTLQSWEDWADGQATADQWAECYSGGDLGEVSISGWTATPSSTRYPRIYVPKAERHEGKDNGAGAYIAQNSNIIGVECNVQYIRVEHLRIESQPTANSIRPIRVNANNVTIDGNLIIIDHNYYGQGIWVENAITPVTIKNNIIFFTSTMTTYSEGIHISSTTNAITVYIYNNTVISNATAGSNKWGIYLYAYTYNIAGEVKNNIAMGFQTLDFWWRESGASITATVEYNMSSDGTADDKGGSGNLVDKSKSNQFVNEDSDWNLLDTSDAYDAGTTISSFDNDALHDPDDDWRPQGDAWDMGAIERGIPTDAVTVTEVFDLLLDVLNIEVNETPTITESVSVLDIVIEVGIVEDTLAVAEWVDQYIGIEIDRYDEVAITESVELGSIWEASVYDEVTSTENVNLSVFSLDMDLSVHDDVTIIEVAQITDIVIELGIVADAIAVAEDISVLLDVLNFSIYEEATIAEDVELLDITIEMSAQEDITIEEFGQACLSCLNLDTYDEVTVTENVAFYWDVWNAFVFDELLITEVGQITDLVIELGVVADTIAIAEDIESSLDVLHLSIYDEVTTSEYAEVLDITVELDAYEEITVQEDIQAVLDVLNLSVFEDLTQTVDEFISLELDVLNPSVSENILITEHVSIVDLVVEVGVVVDTVAIVEDIVPSLDVLHVPTVFEALSITEYVEILDIIIETPTVYDEVSATEDVTVLLSALYLNVQDEVSIAEVATITDIVIELGPAVENISIQEFVTIHDIIVELTASEEIAVTEDISLYLGELFTSVYDEVTTEEYAEVLDITVELPLVYEDIGIIEDISILLPELNVSVYDEVLITEIAQITDLVIELGVVAETIATTEDTCITIGELNIARCESIVIEEHVEVLDITIEMPLVFETITIEENVSTVLDVLVPSVSDDVLITEVAQITDLVIELGIVADTVGITEIAENSLTELFTYIYENVNVDESVGLYLGELMPSVFDAVTAVEWVQLLDITIELGPVFETVSIEEWVQVLDIIVEMSVYDEVGIAEDLQTYLDELFTDVFDTVSIAEYANVWDIIIELGPVFEALTASESVAAQVSDLWLSVYDEVAVTEYATVHDIVIEMSAGEDVSIEEDIAVVLPLLLVNVFDTVSIAEVAIMTDIVIELGPVSDEVAVTEYVNMHDIIVELTAQDEVSIAEDTVLSIGELFPNVYEDISIVEYVEVLDIIVEVPLVFETVSLEETVSILLPELNVDVADSLLITEVGQVHDLVIELGIVEDTVSVTEDAELLPDQLFASAHDEVSIEENAEPCLSCLWLSVYDDVTVTEYAEVLDITVEIPLVFETISVEDSLIDLYLDVLNFSVVEEMVVVVNEVAYLVDIIVEVGIVAEYNYVTEGRELYLDELFASASEDATVTDVATVKTEALPLFGYDEVSVTEDMVPELRTYMEAGDDISVEEYALLGPEWNLAVFDNVSIAESVITHDIVIELGPVYEDINIDEWADRFGILPLDAYEEVTVAEEFETELPLYVYAAEQRGVAIVNVSEFWIIPLEIHEDIAIVERVFMHDIVIELETYDELSIAEDLAIEMPDISLSISDSEELTVLEDVGVESDLNPDVEDEVVVSESVLAVL